MIQKINEIRKTVEHSHPLIHCITNPISINQCANAVLAVGARPIMAQHPKEVCEITLTADALMLNLGNITDVRMQSMLLSAKTAENKNIPVVLDAVGVACSKLRKDFASELLHSGAVTVIKGNYSEINALYHKAYSSSGVDADKSLDTAFVSKVAVQLATEHKTIVLASGKTDIVTDGNRLIFLNNGTPQLSRVTGTGCMLGALCASFLSAKADMDAIVTASCAFGICGELSKTNKGNATFMLNLIDRLSILKDEDIEKHLNLEVGKIEGL